MNTSKMNIFHVVLLVMIEDYETLKYSVAFFQERLRASIPIIFHSDPLIILTSDFLFLSPFLEWNLLVKTEYVAGRDLSCPGLPKKHRSPQRSGISLLSLTHISHLPVPQNASILTPQLPGSVVAHITFTLAELQTGQAEEADKYSGLCERCIVSLLPALHPSGPSGSASGPPGQASRARSH